MATIRVVPAPSCSPLAARPQPEHKHHQPHRGRPPDDRSSLAPHPLRAPSPAPCTVSGRWPAVPSVSRPDAPRACRPPERNAARRPTKLPAPSASSPTASSQQPAARSPSSPQQPAVSPAPLPPDRASVDSVSAANTAKINSSTPSAAGPAPLPEQAPPVRQPALPVHPSLASPTTHTSPSLTAQASPSTVQASPQATPRHVAAPGTVPVGAAQPADSDTRRRGGEGGHRMRSSIACTRCRRSKIKCENQGVGSQCKACHGQGRECTYPVAGTSVSTPRRESLTANLIAPGDRTNGDVSSRFSALSTLSLLVNPCPTFANVVPASHMLDQV
ncbi:hypothetical protein BS50DRAFT_180520 [Corynespora cassiicola Philippines]|uniref:Zn(2)-C6 fungal-type domain-containing protein n=1 Tax=Corynespora cassiicola Philippines TaxID=1448308 RepID=A0A2T2P660_CORCC|nr:hypothetical protein BS50DRAFT_180520 [Corynespora cassiicola Philippines]